MIAFYVKEREVQRFAPVPRPAFRKAGMRSFKWCRAESAHIFNDFSELPRKFLSPSGKLKRRYVLVIVSRE